MVYSYKKGECARETMHICHNGGNAAVRLLYKGRTGYACSFVFDVGKADSFLMTCGGKNLLMDAGTAKDGKKVAKRLEDMGVEA